MTARRACRRSARPSTRASTPLIRPPSSISRSARAFSTNATPSRRASRDRWWMYARDLGRTACNRGTRCSGSGIGPKNTTPSFSSQATVSGTFSVNSRRSSRLSRGASLPAQSPRSSKCCCGVSTIPLRRCKSVPLDATAPTDTPVLPPSRDSFSRSTTLQPALAASIDAASPAPPPPTTMMSACLTGPAVLRNADAVPARASP